MTFLPIVARELRIASRKPETYWVRAGAPAAVILLGTWLFLMMRRQSPREVAAVLFGVLSGAAAFFALLSGVRFTSDCLSVEKREGTLGLLFLTDLKGYDVVFGKLAATSLSAFYAVLAILPMLAIPLLMGGISAGEVCRMALVTTNTLFFSLSVGMAVSALSRSARQAAGVAFFVLMVVAAFLPAFGAWLAFLLNRSTPPAIFLLPSPGFDFVMAFDATFRRGQQQFWLSALFIHLLGWSCLAVACAVAPRVWQDRPAGPKALRWRDRVRLWIQGNVSRRALVRRRRLDQNAFFWLAARAPLKPFVAWGILGVIGCVWIWGVAKYHREWFNEGIYVATGLALNAIVKMIIAGEAGRQLAEDRQIGALELLLSTPLTVGDILRGQYLALRRQLLGPMLLVFGVFLAFMLATVSQNDSGREERAFWFWFWTSVSVMLAVDAVALYWVGLWEGLTAKNPQRASSNTAGKVLMLPWLGFAVVILVGVLVSTGRSREPGWSFYLGAWFAIGLAADLLFIAHARRKLLLEFRSTAARRFEGQPSLLARLRGGATT
jgi:ABC-type transport system involved in multi-copper enzyme maturation permease subunit